METIEEKGKTVRQKTELNLVWLGMSADDAKRVVGVAITKMSCITNYSIDWDNPSGYWSNADQLVIGLYVDSVVKELFPSFNPIIE